MSNESVMLDQVNRGLQAHLHADARITMSELARRVGMSPPAVSERVAKLQEAGVIRGFRVDVDAAALGLPVTAFSRIRPTAGQLSKIADLARSIPQISECHRITGEDCFMVKLHARTVEAIEEILDRFLIYGQTTTSIVVSTPVPARALPVDGGTI